MMYYQILTRVILVGNGHFKMEKNNLFTVVTKIRRKNHTTSQFMFKRKQRNEKLIILLMNKQRVS